MARPLRSSLLVRLLAVSVVVSVLSVAATTWLAVRATTRAIQQEHGQALTDDARIYDALLGYAATHADWSGAGELVRTLARGTGRRIVVTARDRTALLASAPGNLPDRASATVDPLAVDAVSGGSAGGIDPRAVGPFRLTDTERRDLDKKAGGALTCLRAVNGQLRATAGPIGPQVTEPRTGAEPTAAEPAAAPADAAVRAAVPQVVVVRDPSGRPRIETSSNEPPTRCTSYLDDLAEPTATERRALAELARLTNACLTRQKLSTVALSLDGGWSTTQPATEGSKYHDTVESCLTGARRDQLTDYVAPAALLFVLDPDAPAPASGFDLTPQNRARIVGVTALVLLVAVGVTVLVGVRLVRPLHALTAAAGRMRDGDGAARVKVTGHDEIARLGSAFNAMAEQRHHVEELRRSMVGDIAHEMRSPVTNIRGWLEAADDGIVPLDKELVGSLLEEAVLLQHVIDDLQDLSAADAGELRLHPRTFEVPELLHAIADAFAPAAEKAGVALVVRSALTPPWTADPIRLRQAIGNLVANAIRHTPPGGRVTISATLDDPAATPGHDRTPTRRGGPSAGHSDPSAAHGDLLGGHGGASASDGDPSAGYRGSPDGHGDPLAGLGGAVLVVEVADTGPGVPAEQQAMVFERFWRAEKSRNRQTGGSGLGLAIVRKLAEAHGGSVSLISPPGQGATFRLRLPATGPDRPEAGPRLP